MTGSGGAEFPERPGGFFPAVYDELKPLLTEELIAEHARTAAGRRSDALERVLAYFRRAAVTGRRRVRAANWSAIWYLLSAFAVISYTENAVYVVFAATGSWLGAFVSVTWLRRGHAEVAQTHHNPL